MNHQLELIYYYYPYLYQSKMRMNLPLVYKERAFESFYFFIDTSICCWYSSYIPVQ